MPDMAELDVEALRRAQDWLRWIIEETSNLVVQSHARTLIAALEDRERLRAWIDNHEFFAAYPSLTECIEDQRRAAMDDCETLDDILHRAAPKGPR